MCDFNTICSPFEHKVGPYSYYIHRAKHFLDFINGNFLLDLVFVGIDYT